MAGTPRDLSDRVAPALLRAANVISIRKLAQRWGLPETEILELAGARHFPLFGYVRRGAKALGFRIGRTNGRVRAETHTVVMPSDAYLPVSAMMLHDAAQAEEWDDLARQRCLSGEYNSRFSHCSKFGTSTMAIPLADVMAFETENVELLQLTRRHREQQGEQAVIECGHLRFDRRTGVVTIAVERFILKPAAAEVVEVLLGMECVSRESATTLKNLHSRLRTRTSTTLRDKFKSQEAAYRRLIRRDHPRSPRFWLATE